MPQIPIRASGKGSAQYAPPTIDKRLDELPPEIWDEMESLTMIESDLLTGAIGRLNREKLHAFVEVYNWDDGTDALMSVLNHEQCDRGTALAIYWLSEPDYWIEKTQIKEWEKELFDILKKAEERLLADDFVERNIPFEIQTELGATNAYWKGIAQNDKIPESLKPTYVSVSPPAFDGSPRTLPSDEP